MIDSFTSFTIGKYHATALLGKGGFGTVYRATDTMLDREVALKVLHAQLVVDDDFVRRFKNEAKVIASLRHPNIVGVYELGEDNGRWFIAMEYMPGGTLADRLARGPLPFAEAAAVLRQVCAGLETAHARDIIHRDLKPANILFDAQGQAVVSDFGLMRAAQLSTGSASSSSGAVGTPFYKAPELWRGKPPASPATDVYALGCMLYEMLAGRVLFSGETPDEVLTKHLIDGPDFGPNWPPADAPAGLLNVVNMALARKMDERYQTAGELARVVGDERRKTEDERRGREEEERKALERKAEEQVAREAEEKRKREAERQKAAYEAEERRARERKAEEQTRQDADMPPPPTQTLTPGWVWLVIAGVVSLLGWAVWPKDNPPATAIPMPTNTPALGIGFTRTRESDGMVEVYVPAGEFLMGSDKTQDKDARDDELPQHTVYLDAYWIDQTEVTNAMFAQFAAQTNYQTDADKGGSGYVYNLSTKSWEDTQGANWQHPRGPASDLSGLDQHPVVLVSWNDATAYCQWAGAQLPAEAQWEKAARGTDGHIYPWGNQSVAGNLLNFADANLAVDWADKSVNDGYEFTAPVSHYPAGASPYGALDMAGNVWEWMAGWYSKTYYQDSPLNNPIGPTSGDYRVLRGGSWDSETQIVRTTYRYWVVPDILYNFNGFRCLRPFP